MAIDFDASRWEQVKNDYEAWWAGQLRRPLVAVSLAKGRDPGRAKPETPLLSQASVHDLSISVESLVDRLDWELSTMRFLGDAYPSVCLDVFGPGVVAAFLGAVLDNSTGHVWFKPQHNVPIADLHLEYDPDNRWLRRIKDLCAAAMKRWQGQVLVTMPDLGGAMDILSTFRPADQLLLDLYDYPEHVHRLMKEIHELWHRFYRELDEVLLPVNPGHSSWCGIYSKTPYYILQCDFCYMIGTDMFREFVLPELDASTRRLDRSFYHLDGKGQLPHLDSLLEVPQLCGVQWVPGQGNPDPPQWPEVFERIFAAGKKAQIFGPLPDIHAMLKRTGLGAGVHLRHHALAGGPDESEVRRWLDCMATTDFR